MTSLEDIADDTGDVYLARNLAGMAFRLDSRETVPCDQIGTDDFPAYGDFIPVGCWHPPEAEFVDECYVEASTQLAKTIVDLGLEAGDTFKVEEVTKSDGQFYFVVDDDWEA